MGMYDPIAIKEAVDLTDLVSRDTPLRRVSGDEHAGPCPKCGGDDRFHVRPTGWFCRQCHYDDAHPWSDAIAYIMWRDGIPFTEACALLGGEKVEIRRDAPVRER